MTTRRVLPPILLLLALLATSCRRPVPAGPVPPAARGGFIDVFDPMAEVVGEIVLDDRGEVRERIVVVRREDGTLVLERVVTLLTPSIAPSLSPDPLGLVLQRSPPFAAAAATVVHQQAEEVENESGERVRRVIVVAVGIGEDLETETTIYVFDQDLKLIETVVVEGGFRSADYSDATGEKLFLLDREDGLHWVVLDVLTGGKRAESDEPLDSPLEVLDLELVGGFLVVVHEWRGGTWVRMRVYDRGGRLLHLIDMPGEFLAALDNGRDLKALVTQKDGTVYQDLVDLSSGRQANPAGPTGLPQNGIDGEHRHLQHDTIPEDRFVEIVYDAGRDETVVRILDGAGRIVGTQVLNGEFRAALRVGRKKVVAVERGGDSEAVVVDLATGRQGPHVTEQRGSFRDLSQDETGRVTLETDEGSTTVEVR